MREDTVAEWEADEFNNLSLDEKSRLFKFMYNQLFLNIDLWIPGKKIILANKIDVPSGEDENNIRKYVEKKYDIPNKYHIEDVYDFQRSPWIVKLFYDGRLEPTREELIDFCAYCLGTYAILRIQPADSEYYAVYLSSSESIEKLKSSRVYTSPI